MSERDQAAAGIVEDLEIARGCAELTFVLRNLVRQRTPLARLADDFVWFSLRALRDSAVIHLWKVVDTQKRVRSLPWFIRYHSALPETERRADLARIAASASDISRLARIRHQVFAHRGSEQGTTRPSDILDANNFTEDEFLLLIKECSRLLRRHHGRHLSRQVMQDAGNAVRQALEIDTYLEDAYRGFGGGLQRQERLFDVGARRSRK